MQKNDKIKLNSYLAPLSFLYGIGIWLRNRLFDWGILHSEQYSIPVICIGNLSVGGTGKTPHTEYIIRLLKDKYRIAVLSRGYKRKTSGFILADSERKINFRIYLSLSTLIAAGGFKIFYPSLKKTDLK